MKKVLMMAVVASVLCSGCGIIQLARHLVVGFDEPEAGSTSGNPTRPVSKISQADLWTIIVTAVVAAAVVFVVTKSKELAAVPLLVGLVTIIGILLTAFWLPLTIAAVVSAGLYVGVRLLLKSKNAVIEDLVTTVTGAVPALKPSTQVVVNKTMKKLEKAGNLKSNGLGTVGPVSPPVV